MNAIYKFVLGLIGKRSGVITTLPNKKQIEFQANMLAEKFMQNGIDPNALKSPEQVKNVLANIDQSNMRVISADSAEGKGITEQLLGKKKADVMDMEGNKIPEGSQIMGGKQIKPINMTVEERTGGLLKGKYESDEAIKTRLVADNKKGIAGIKINLVDDSITKIKSMEPMDAMKEANLVAGKKGRYANLDDNQVKKIMDDTQEHIFQDSSPLDDYATGGRVGLKGGAFLNFIKNMTMNKKSPLQFGKDYLKNVKKKTLNANETGKFMDLPLAEVGIPAATGALVNNQIRKKLKNMNEDQKEENLKMFIMELENDEFYNKYPDIKDEMIADYTEKLFGEKKADGGRIGLKGGSGLLKFLKKFKIKQSGDGVKEFLSKRKFIKDLVGNTEKNKQARELADIKRAMTDVEGYKFPEVSKEDIEKKIAPILLKDRKLNSDGGRIGLEGGTNEDFQNYLKEREKFEKQKSIEQLFRDYKEDLRKKGVMEQKQMAADGGRIGYKVGSVDKMRRLFLQAMGAGTVGVGAAKSGIFSFGKGAGKTIAKEVAQQTTSSMPPPYFFKLAEKIKKLGSDVTSVSDRTTTKSLKSKDGKAEYLLEEDVSTGDTLIKKINKEGDDMVTDVEIMEFKKGDVVEGKDGKAIKTPDNYEEVTEANARIEGDVYNDPYYTDGINVDDIIKEIDDKTPSIKYAQGGLAYMLGE